MSDSIEEDKAHSSGQVVHNEQENSTEASSEQDQAGTRQDKRKTGRSGKSNASKRSRGDTASTVTVEETDESEDEEEEDPEGSEDISLGVIVRRLNCRVSGCEKAFPGKAHLDEHLLVSHAIEKYACKVKDCTESFSTIGQLTIHRNDVHDSLHNNWPCAQCKVICNTYNDLWTHTWHYHEYGEFACSADKCDYTEATRIQVYNHQREHRSSIKCTYPGCSLIFYQKLQLTNHSRVHSQEKPFLCAQCRKAFARKDALIAHERVHSGLKPYSCTWPHCDYTASGQSNVIRHIRGVHFALPQTKKKQKEKGISDARDARLFVKKATAGN